jgi:hypothetical protein
VLAAATASEGRRGGPLPCWMPRRVPASGPPHARRRAASGTWAPAPWSSSSPRTVRTSSSSWR